MKNRKQAAVLLMAAGLLSGCFGAKPEQELYTVYEKAIIQEQDLPQKAAKLEELEQTGQQQYDRVLQDGKEDSAKAKAAIDTALQLIDEREKLVQEEKELLDQAQKAMSEAKDTRKELKSTDLQEQAGKVETLYKERLQSFQAMYQAYMQVIADEKQMYTMLAGKTSTIKEMADQVRKVNEGYQKVHEQREQFNEQTRQYNQEKIAFYKQAGLAIKETK